MMASAVYAGYDMETLSETEPWGWLSIPPSNDVPYALSGSYGTREVVLADQAPAQILYISSLLSGELISDRAHVLFYT